MEHPIEHWRRAAALTLAVIFLHTAAGLAQSTADQESEEPDEALVFEDRIVTPQDLDEVKPGATLPFRIIGWPFAKLLDGMEAGLISFEKNKIRQKIYDAQMKLAAIGFRPLFGGLGEGAGFGAGTVYEVPPGGETAVRLLGRMSFAGYQELALNFISSPLPRSSFIVLTNYQWRPNEPYSGHGQDSPSSDRSSFALRQTSFAAQWEQRPVRRLRFGAEYTVAMLKALGSTGGRRPSVEETFGEDLPGLNQRIDLQSFGAFFEADLLQGDYNLGGRAVLGASWQDSIGDVDIRYARMEGRLEGRLPLVRGRSALVGQASTELLREDRGTAPLPFYLYPRIGGSATLRGFPLDRFYGRNMILLTLEYRYAIHPNVEAEIFFDEGQIFEHTRNLRFLDWHRNYGFGLRFKNATGTQFLFELAESSEGWTIHISFGGRPSRPLGGPVRYPLYRP